MRVLLLATAVVLTFGTLVRADPPDARKRHEQMCEHFMEKFDKSKDGKLNADEIPERLRRRFAAIEANGDG